METVTWRELSKLLRLALIGISAAFGAVVVSVLLGIGVGAAHADDSQERGLLGAVGSLVGGATDLVGDVTSGVSSTLTGVTSTATDVVNTVVEVAPAPVQQPVAAVVETAGTTVETVVAPVQQIVSNDVVTAVTTPVVEVVTAVPVVGDLVSQTGVDQALLDLAATVDGTLTNVVTTVEETGSALTPPAAQPTIPVDPADVPTVAPAFAPATAAVIDATEAQTPQAAVVAASAIRTAVPASSSIRASAPDAASEVPATATAQSAGATGAPGSSGGLCLSSALSGPGGAGSGAWALALLLPFVAHRAWVRRAGPDDELAPPAPAESTDVAPD